MTIDQLMRDYFANPGVLDEIAHEAAARLDRRGIVCLLGGAERVIRDILPDICEALYESAERGP